MPAAPAVQAGTGGHYGVQLGAFKANADAANKHWAWLEQKYPKLLSGLSPKVSPKKISSGTLYRLQVANLSEKHARALCKSLKASSQACVVLKP
jgi:cell division septation protein DedD